MNTSTGDPFEQRLSHFLAALGQPARILILLVMRTLPSCVCHLEATLGMRQASISQHLMVLRRAGMVVTQREGRHIFYRLADEHLLDILYQAARLQGIPTQELDRLAQRPQPGCPCPQCNEP